ncbi:hypothetical protein F3N42_15345 [Marinihelvus fidelis]|uniref:JmjC domain-containing protein n=1 Tax=Marinihelvus fidelis TaxID=2613842 RepID=A0A5N0T438_9GAMM|nr:cupin domain-containing protein [Marinihelvus fidelis]KAA9129568.1 hypothetical protein F3N42_15345 [Marinihelvus fidelis]
MTPESARELLTNLVRPETYDSFMDGYVGRRFLHARSGDNALAGIIGPDPAATILDAHDRFAHTLTCHSGSAQVPSPRARRVADRDGFAALLAEYHQARYTVRIPDATTLSPELARLCRALEMLFENPASAAIFWSTDGLDAPVHHDEYDILIIQLAGSKQWYISSDAPTLPNTWKGAGEPAPPLPNYRTVDVVAGDVLYLPRGTAHTVKSTTESIHLSIGFLPVTVRQALIAMVDAMAEANLPLRTGATTRADALALDRQGGLGEVAQHVRTALSQLQQAGGSDAYVRDAMARRRARLIEDMPRLARNDAPAPQLQPQTRLHHHPLAMAQLLATPQVADLRLPGDRVLTHPGATPALQWIIGQPEFVIADIPGGLPDEVKLALAGRLVASGYLEPVSGE